MGQRSQIYIRYNVTEDENVYKGLIARYYGWNYGERMVSRARYILEELSYFMERKYLFSFPEKIEKLKRICDVNFDMKDIVISSDIIQEVKEDFASDTEYIFNQDNNDGQLYIDVTDEGIRYCFTKYCHEGEPMNGEQYMKWNCEYEKYKNWHKPSEFRDENTIGYTEKNIKSIEKLGVLMSTEELEDFISEDYSYLFE